MDRDAAKTEAFMRHLQPLQGALEGFARRTLNDPDAVADVLQAAVAAAYRQFEVYAEGTNFRAWIFRFVHLEVFNCNRKSRRTRHEPLQDEISINGNWDGEFDVPQVMHLLDDPQPLLERCDEALARAIADLPDTDRDVFLLRAIGEFKYGEIAQILTIPLGTVMSSLSRSRVRLRRMLTESDPSAALPPHLGRLRRNRGLAPGE